MQNAGGIVSLRLTLHGIPGQMGAPKIDTQKSLPVSDVFVRLKVHLPAGAAVQLREHPLFVKLSGYGGNLGSCPITGILFRQNVNAGVIHVLIVTHQRSLHGGLAAQRIFMKYMSRENHMVFVAPFLDGLGEIFQE